MIPSHVYSNRLTATLKRSVGRGGRLYRFLLLMLVMLPTLVFANESAGVMPKVFVLQIDGAISPATADYLIRGMETAKARQASAVIIQMDTPGGLDKSMRSIIKVIIASPVPVIAYVSPSGARAASAGTYILYASHIAAMSPATNLGAATPVSLGGGGSIYPGPADKKPAAAKPDAKQQDPARATPATKPATKPAAAKPAQAQDASKQKVVNDAAAYIKGLAELHGRNSEWAVTAVREAASLSAKEALASGVIDVIATDITALLSQLEGKRVKVLGKWQSLQTKNATLIRILPDWRTRLLTVITDPSVAYILLLLGMYGIFFEFANPGFVVPGVVGGICILLAMYALQLLPINFAGLALLILGVIFMLIEALMPSFGALGIGGAVAFVAGSVLLIDTSLPGLGVSLPVIVLMTVINLVFFLGIFSLALRTRRLAVVSGAEGMLGMQGIALEPIELRGQVRVNSEIWQACATQPIAKGDTVIVKSIDGLVLVVEACAPPLKTNRNQGE